MNTTATALVLTLFSTFAAAGCSTTITPPPGSEAAEHAKRWCNGQATVTMHAYVWGSYTDRICTDANGNSTTTRVISNGLYD
jgi:hypothetical protein